MRTIPLNLAAHLDGQRRRPLDEPHPPLRRRSEVIGGVGAERLAARGQLGHGEPHAVGEGDSLTDLVGVVAEAHGDLERDAARLVSGGHEVDDPPTDQLGLAVDPEEVIQRGPRRGRGRHARGSEGSSGRGSIDPTPAF